MCPITFGWWASDHSSDCASVFVPDICNQTLRRLESRTPGILVQNVFLLQSLSRLLSLDLKVCKVAQQLNVETHQVQGCAVLWTLGWFPLRIVCRRSEDAFNLGCDVQWRDCSTLFVCRLVEDKAAFSFKGLIQRSTASVQKTEP